MHYLVAFVIVLFIVLYLIIGGVIIWPLINVCAYLKGFIFPSAVRKRYGSNIAALSKNSFDQEITEEDKNELTRLLHKKQQSLKLLRSYESDLAELGPLKTNKDGSINKRSNAGKQGATIRERISSVKGEIFNADYAIRSLEGKPHAAWSEWSSSLCRYLGNRVSLFFMIIAFPFFFMYLPVLNLLEIQDPTIGKYLEIYTYIIFVAPVAEFGDISFFKIEFFSFFISYDYAVLLGNNYDYLFTLSNWVTMSLPMPFMTLIFYLANRNKNIDRAKAVEPE